MSKVYATIGDVYVCVYAVDQSRCEDEIEADNRMTAIEEDRRNDGCKIERCID